MKKMNESNILRFNSNWNNKFRNSIFSTIRSYDAEKHQYYAKNFDEYFDVRLDDIHIMNAKLIHITRMTYSQIPYELKVLDTGLLDIKVIDELFAKFNITAESKVLFMLFQKEVR